LAELVTENVARHGLNERFSGAAHTGFVFNDVLAAFSDPEPLIKRFEAAARQMIAGGAEVIIPGEAPLNVMLARNGISEVDGVPVVDSLGAWIKQAETLVDLRRTSGIRPCRSSYFSGLPDKDRVDEILKFYGYELPPQ